MNRREKLQLVTAVVAGLFLVALIVHYWSGSYDGSGYPFSTYLFNPSDQIPARILEPMPARLHTFGDLLSVWEQTRTRAPYAAVTVFSSNYLPFTHVVMAPFAMVSYRWAVALFALTFLASLVTFHYALLRPPGEGHAGTVAALLSLTLLTYPVHFTFDRGNVEVLVFTMAWVATWAYLRGRDDLAALLIGAAAAMKGYPALFALLFVSDRKWRPLLLSGGVAVALTLLSAMGLAGGLTGTFNGFRGAMQNYAAVATAQGEHSVALNSSLWTVLEAARLYGGEWLASARWLAALSEGYSLLVGLPLLALLVLAVAVGRKLQAWEKTALIAVSFILVPQVSYDYKLLHLLIPVALLVAADTSDRWSAAWCVAFALLLVPKRYGFFGAGLALGQFLNPLLLLGIGTGLALRAYRQFFGEGPLPPALRRWRAARSTS